VESRPRNVTIITYIIHFGEGGGDKRHAFRKLFGQLLRILLPRTPVNRSLYYYSSLLENPSKASRAFEVFSRLGPCSPHAKHRATQ
jgi:hypothetical protein